MVEDASSDEGSFYAEFPNLKVEAYRQLSEIGVFFTYIHVYSADMFLRSALHSKSKYT